MIARLLTASVFVLGFASLGYAQENAPASAAAAVTTDATAAADAARAAVPAAAPASAMAAVVGDPKDYRIGPEDVLDVLVWKNPELSRTVPVRPDGKISLALVNDIVASGLTANELRAQLTDRYSQFIQAPEVSVIIKEIHSFKVAVQGNVRMAGQFEVKSQATVLDMISRAQGFNEFADKGDIRVLRTTNGKTQSIKFKYNDATDGREGANFLVLPGDIIVVN